MKQVTGSCFTFLLLYYMYHHYKWGLYHLYLAYAAGVCEVMKTGLSWLSYYFNLITSFHLVVGLGLSSSYFHVHIPFRQWTQIHIDLWISVLPKVLFLSSLVRVFHLCPYKCSIFLILFVFNFGVHGKNMPTTIVTAIQITLLPEALYLFLDCRTVHRQRVCHLRECHERLFL